MREVQASNGFSAQGDHRLLFGLGARAGAVDVNILWCGKYLDKRTLAIDQYHAIGFANTNGIPATQASHPVATSSK
jgi:ASPIC and UnbV